jgi:hypothetical protein
MERLNKLNKKVAKELAGVVAEQLITMDRVNDINIAITDERVTASVNVIGDEGFTIGYVNNPGVENAFEIKSLVHDLIQGSEQEILRSRDELVGEMLLGAKLHYNSVSSSEEQPCRDIATIYINEEWFLDAGLTLLKNMSVRIGSETVKVITHPILIDSVYLSDIQEALLDLYDGVDIGVDGDTELHKLLLDTLVKNITVRLEEGEYVKDLALDNGNVVVRTNKDNVTLNIKANMAELRYLKNELVSKESTMSSNEHEVMRKLEELSGVSRISRIETFVNKDGGKISHLYVITEDDEAHIVKCLVDVEFANSLKELYCASEDTNGGRCLSKKVDTIMTSVVESLPIDEYPGVAYVYVEYVLVGLNKCLIESIRFLYNDDKCDVIFRFSKNIDTTVTLEEVLEIKKLLNDHYVGSK